VSQKKRKKRQSERRLKRIWVTLGALGVLSAVGTYYVPGILHSGGELIIHPAPLQYTATYVRSDPVYVFPSSTSPGSIPAGLLRRIFWRHQFSAIEPWALSHGGIPVAPQIRLVLSGRDARPVIINSLAIRIVRERRLKGGWFNGWYGCGGVVDVRAVVFNLDRNVPYGSWSDRHDSEIRPPTLRLTDTDNEVIDVDVHTSRSNVIYWVIILSYSFDGRSGTFVINDHGKPFSVTSVTNSIAYVQRFKPKLTRQPSLDDGANGGGNC